MNNLQQTEFEILNVFLDLCETLKLKYYLVCGSALGAVKYSGFIPWDDDIDVAMPRKDYETFLEQAPSLLPCNIFLQNNRSEEAFPAIYSKLRRSDTTYIEESAAKLNINHGVFIDIFPLDGYPRKRASAIMLELKKRIYKRLLASAFIQKSAVKRLLYFPFALALRAIGVRRAVRGYERLIMRYPLEKSEIITNHGNWQGKRDYADKDVFGDGIEMRFESRRVRVPEKYREYLERKYGDYNAELPESEKQGHHTCSVLDLEKPYTDYVRK